LHPTSLPDPPGVYSSSSPGKGGFKIQFLEAPKDIQIGSIEQKKGGIFSLPVSFAQSEVSQ
jgi:hypothetical protein